MNKKEEQQNESIDEQLKKHQLLKPKVQESTIIFQHFFHISSDTLLLPPQYQEKYSYFQLLTKRDAVFILATVQKNNSTLYVINREYRHPTGEFLYSLPGGMLSYASKKQISCNQE